MPEDISSSHAWNTTEENMSSRTLTNPSIKIPDTAHGH